MAGDGHGYERFAFAFAQEAGEAEGVFLRIGQDGVQAPGGLKHQSPLDERGVGAFAGG
ncbi:MULTISPECIES: hypothetical protein [Hyphomonas]|uniref:hypothetical protein n=1 Tax=Hyphomonas TaxID=85 RepID=UPI0012EC759B|nr:MULTISPECIES: hypothetical protein [Hyphomonas]